MIDRRTPYGDPLPAPRFAMPTDAEGRAAMQRLVTRFGVSLCDVMVACVLDGVLVMPMPKMEAAR